MADLSQFLNSGGKRSRIVSGDSGMVSDAQTLTLSPANNEFIQLWGRVTNDQNTTISVTGRGGISFNSNTIDNDLIPITFGIGEEVVIANNSGAAKGYSYRIYEEDV